MSGGYYGGYGPPPEPAPRRPGARRALTVVAMIGIAFAVSAAVVIGSRLSDQAISILAGSVCGVTASIPTALIIIFVTRRQSDTPPPRHDPQQYGGYPPVIVVGPGGQLPQQAPYQSPPVNLLDAPIEREFTVLG